MKKNIVPIVLTFDDNFFIPAVVTIISMLKNKKESSFYDVFILHDGEKLSDKFKMYFKKIEEDYKEDIAFEFINLEGFGDNFTILQDKDRFSVSVYFRVFLHKFIKRYDKVLYSDVDVIVLDDLYEVYSTNLKDNCLGVVKQALVNSWDKERFDKYKGAQNDIALGSYFNAGFLLVNLKEIRDMNIDDKLISLSSKGFNNNDQDLLNLVYQGKVIFLPPRYNITPLFDFFDALSEDFLIEQFSEKWIKDYKNNPAIIHYCTIKPWNIEKVEIVNLEPDALKLWFDYLLLSLKYIPKALTWDIFSEKIFSLLNDKSSLLNDRSWLSNELEPFKIADGRGLVFYL